MSTSLRQYFRGATLAAVRDVQAGKNSYYHFDHQGSTQFLTDSTGTVTDTFASDAWGNQVKRTGTSINRNWYIGGLGYYRGVDSAVDYVRARQLVSWVGRWKSRDPLASPRRIGQPALRPLGQRRAAHPAVPRQRSYQAGIVYRRGAELRRTTRGWATGVGVGSFAAGPRRANLRSYEPYSYSEDSPVSHSDPMGLLTIKPFDPQKWDVGNRPGLCGLYRAMWNFTLTTLPICDGWIVQSVQLTEDYDKCGNLGFSHRTRHYFEAWPVDAGWLFPPVVPPYGDPNDTFTALSRPGTQSHGEYGHTHLGEARFYCEIDTGQLDILWSPPVPEAGGLPSIYALAPNWVPDFWYQPSADPPDVLHWCKANWCCCGDPKTWTSKSICSPT